jgi:hypothetical protein
MPPRNGYRSGDWLYTCQRCGFTYYASQVRQEWTGLRVCASCWDPRHPQEFVRGVRDDQTVPYANPPSAPRFLLPNEVSFDGDLVLAPSGDSVASPDGSVVLSEF